MEAIGSAAVGVARQPGWIYNKTWDLTLIIFSAVLVPMPFLLAYGAQAAGVMSEKGAIDLVNILVAGLIGGPHLFSTFTYTFMNKGFLRQHPYYALGAFVLPGIVVYMGLYHYEYLILFFFTWASVHLLHQIIYISDCYRARSGVEEPRWSRWVDYGVILTGLYPIGLYKLATGTFNVGGVTLPYPDHLRPYPVPQIAGFVFFGLLAVWIWKTAVESREGRMSSPKALLIGITSLVSFLLPLGQNLDILFQGYNTWHSFQYLFLFWLINRLRYERGEIDSPWVRKLVSGKSMIPYYLCFLVCTGIMVLITLVVRATTDLSPDQSYFTVVLSILLMHYYFDHFLFTRTDYVA